jgi:hypothetical protein
MMKDCSGMAGNAVAIVAAAAEDDEDGDVGAAEAAAAASQPPPLPALGDDDDEGDGWTAAPTEEDPSLSEIRPLPLLAWSLLLLLPSALPAARRTSRKRRSMTGAGVRKSSGTTQ